MFHSSLKHRFDIMFVLLCVIAGATSHTVSNTSKSSINQLNNHYLMSFMDFILDASLDELLQKSNKSQTVCALLSNVLIHSQLRFCLKHQDILKAILPQVIQLTRKECTRITSDLRWNCSTIDFLLDRSSPLGKYSLFCT